MVLPFFVTPFYAALCGILLVVLSLRVSLLRRKHGVGIGDGGQPELQRAIRVQGNFIEYVPLGLILLLLLEISHQVPGWALHGLGLLLVAARISHALAYSRSSGTNFGRAFGGAGTYLMVLVAALWLLFVALAALRL